MREHLVFECKDGAEVPDQQLAVGVHLNHLVQLLIHDLLILLALSTHLVRLLLFLQDNVGGFGRLLAILVHATEIFVAKVFGQIDLANVQLGPCGNHVVLVNAAQRATVNLERAVNKEETALELLEENDALSTVATSNDDQNSSWSDATAQITLMLVERLLSSGSPQLALRLYLVHLRQFLDANETLSTVLIATDRLLDVARSPGSLGLWASLHRFALVVTLNETILRSLMVHATARESPNAIG